MVLLELLTGLQAIDPTRPGGQHNLIEWAKPSLSEKRKLVKMMDPRLENEYPSKAATQAAALILKCLEGDPRKRPSMEEVLATLQKVALIKPKPKEVRSRSENLGPPSIRDEPSPLHRPHHHLRHRHHRSPMHGRDGGPTSARSL